MLYSCPNYELSGEMIIRNFYARLSLDKHNLLDTSCVGSYMLKTVDFKWALWKELNATLNIGVPTMVRSQV